MFSDTNYNYIAHGYTACLAMFMSKYTTHYRYKGQAELRRIPDSDESFIYIVLQDNPLATVANLIHELIHWIICKLFFNSRKLHKLLDKIDNPKRSQGIK